MSLFPSSREHAELEQRLRAGAASFGPPLPGGLHARILSGLRSAPAEPRVAVARSRERFGSWIAAAAALLVLCSAWWLARRAEPTVERPATVVAFSRDLLAAGTRVLNLPVQAEGNLRLEAENLLADTARAAEGVVRGLPGPLRARLEKL